MAQAIEVASRPTGHFRWLVASACLAVLMAGVPAAARAAGGRVEGRIARADGSAVGGVMVYVDEREAPAATAGADGRFGLAKLEAGPHTVRFVLGSNLAERQIEVTDGETVQLEIEVDWVYTYTESLTVSAASRRVERIVDAPSAISSLTPEQIEREAASGQLPKLLESAPGAEITQSGLYDFKLNVRGANTLANRRIGVLIDGRNPSFPLLEAQEWAAVSFPLDDLAAAELVRGPSSALYGANAFNGILDLRTKAPHDHLGGFVRLTGGELDTAHVDLGVYAALGGGWYFKTVAGYHESADFSRSRNLGVEYSRPCVGLESVDCLAIEAAPLQQDRVQIPFVGLRFDKDLENGRGLVIEGGTSEPRGFVFSSAGGRFQLTGVERPWARFNFASQRWNLLAYYTGRETSSLTLRPGSLSYDDSSRLAVELQTRWQFAGDRGRIVAGVFASREEVDTADPQGVQTLLERPIDADYQAVFGQIDYDLSEKVKLVLAGRWDESSLYSGRFSPKASVVWAVRPLHTLRFGFNEAFLVPNYPEFFVRVPLIPPLELQVFEQLFCAPVGVACGFDRAVPFLGVGNRNLEVEQIRSIEAGYRGILGGSTFLTVDTYYSEIEDFVRSGVPLVGTSLGRANPDFGPYAAPGGLPPALAGALEATLALALGPTYFFLSNPVADQPVIAFLTLANVGRVETQGIELAIDHTFGGGWSADFNYSWIDFSYREELPEAPLGFNSPGNKFNLGVSYVDDKFSASAHYRWVEGFRWTEGVINGLIPSYDVVNLVVNYKLAEGWDAGVQVSNLFDQEHIEVFSGDLMGRRALAHVKRRW